MDLSRSPKSTSDNMQVDIIIHSTDLSSEMFATQIMGRRVKQGYPIETFVKIDDQPQTAYGWTDGIDSIFSIFLPANEGKVKEICIVTYSLSDDYYPTK
jgi:hypothetical protein